MHQPPCPCHQNQKCPCQCVQTRDILGVVSQPPLRAEMQTQFVNHLHQFFDDITEELIVTDPYIFRSDNTQWYPNFLMTIFEPFFKKVKKITFVTMHNRHKTLVEMLAAAAMPYNCAVRHIQNRFFHDRFWLGFSSNRKIKGIYIGTSLTGIGGKYSYMGLLPDADVQAAYDALRTVVERPLSKHDFNCACYDSDYCRCKCQTRDLLGYGVQIVEKKEIQVAFTAALHAAISNSTQHLIVTDPYIFNCHDKQLSWYPRFLKSVFEPIYPIVKKITFVTSQQYDRLLLTNLQYNAKKGGCHIKHFTNNLFHDRFWVSAGTQTGLFVGNSLTSIGSQYCYLGALPSADVQVALKALRTYL